MSIIPADEMRKELERADLGLRLDLEGLNSSLESVAKGLTRMARAVKRETDACASIRIAMEGADVLTSLGEPDGPWWVHLGWRPYGATLRWSAPSGPYQWRVLAEIRSAYCRAHRVEISSSEAPPVSEEASV